VEIGTEAAQFPEKEYINGFIVAVWSLKTGRQRHKGRSGYTLKPAKKIYKKISEVSVHIVFTVYSKRSIQKPEANY
jgi:hypothetical protein